MRQTRGPAAGKTRGARWTGTLFGLVFAGVGAGFLLLGVIPNLWDAIRMQDWVQVPAEVVALDLQTNQSDDATTYRVIARFEYEYQGRRYTGERVGIADGGSDNVGDWQRDTYSRLRARLRGADQVSLWVNPPDPSESIFDRELRWGLLGFKMIFVVVFGGFGGATLWYFNRTPAPVPPGLPAWQARPAWRDNNIRSDARSTLWFAWGFTLFWNAMSSPLPFILRAELAKGNALAWVGFVFPAIGIGLLIWASRQTLNWRRFGITPLHMDPFPGAIGGDVGGAVELRLRYDPKHRFHVTLTCSHARIRRTGKGSETVRVSKWQDEQLAEVQPGRHGTRLRFLFRPPSDLPESSEGGDSWYEWSLQISASLPGTDFVRSWEVPVVKQAGPQSAREAIRRRPLEVDSQEWLDGVVQMRETGTGLELYYPYLRHLGLAAGTAVTGVAFVGFAWLFHNAAGGEEFPRLFIGLFALVGILILLWGIYLPANSLRVIVGRQGLSAVRGIFGLRFERRAALEEILKIEKSIGLQTTQGKRTRVYYRIRVHTRDGRSITAGSGIPGATRADAIMQRIRQALDLPGLPATADTSGGGHEEAPAALPRGDAEESRRGKQRARRLANAVGGMLFFAFVLWQFRQVIFRLL